MIEKCIFEHRNAHYLELLSQYIRKGDIDDNSGELSAILDKFLHKYVWSFGSLQQFLSLFLQICDCCDIKFAKLTIKKVLNQIGDKECEKMLNKLLKKEHDIELAITIKATK